MIEEHGFAHAVESEFGCVVGGASGEWVFGGQAADVDDEACTGLAHGGDGGAGAEKGSGEVDVDGTLPIGDGEVSSRLEDADTGVGDENVDAAHLLGGKGEEAAYIIFAGDIGGDPVDVRVVAFGDRGSGTFRGSAAEGDRGSGGEERFDDGASNAAGTSGDDGALVGERGTHA